MLVPPLGWFALSLLIVAPEGSAAERRVDALTMNGQVIELSAVLTAAGLVCDHEPIARQVVLRGADGTITPLLSDEASRALFVDGRLRNRPIEIHGRRYPGLPYLQVVSFQVEHEGRLRTPEYFCEVCTISVRYPQECPCCQGPMELRMKPEAP